MKLLMLKGLPGSGKSTYAKTLLEKGGWVRVNKDDLRAMMHNSKHSSKKEVMILRVRDLIVKEALERNLNVVVDDTNFHPKHEVVLKEIAKEYGATFIAQFIATPIEVCLERDLARPNSVGPKVIWAMYNEYLKPEVDPIPEIETVDDAPWAVICDIDGTLADMKKDQPGSRGPFDWKRVGEDVLVRQVAFILERMTYNSGIVVILVSGRDEVCRPETEQWLKDNKIKYDALFMRPEGSMEKDTIVKERIYNEEILGKYNVEFVLDDRDQVVKMWRSKGLKCLQVAEGDF